MSQINGVGGSVPPQPYTCNREHQAAPEANPPQDTEAPRKIRGGRDEYTPGKAAGKPSESVTGNTDKVDAEIRKLKKQLSELEARLASEQDPAKCKELEKQISALKDELEKKDNDAYRREHTVFSR